jgi:hypothetical protein
MSLNKRKYDEYQIKVCYYLYPSSMPLLLGMFEFALVWVW